MGIGKVGAGVAAGAAAGMPLVGLGLGLADWLGGAWNEMEQNQKLVTALDKNLGYISNSITALNEQRETLGEAFKLEKGNITNEYGEKFGGMIDSFDKAKSKAGLEFSGTINRKENVSKDNLLMGFGKQLGGLEANKLNTFANLDKQLNDLNSQAEQFKIQRDYAESHTSFFENLF